MQTFLPHKDFSTTAKILDNKRLGKQRVEGLQILSCLLLKETHWKNHPAVLMWKGYEDILLRYIRSIMDEWKNRGFKNDLCEIKWNKFSELKKMNSINIPYWLTDKFVIHHRSNLLRKNPEYYSQYNWNIPDDLPYIWPRIKI